MAAEVWFYHLERSEIEAALPPLLDKCLARGWRALVRGGLAERLDALDLALWTSADDSFLPHAKAGLGPKDARQPILLTQGQDNPNGAKALVLVDNAEPGELAGFERVILMFDGRDEDALKAARASWKRLKGEGLNVVYWKETARGGWEKQA